MRTTPWRVPYYYRVQKRSQQKEFQTFVTHATHSPETWRIFVSTGAYIGNSSNNNYNWQLPVATELTKISLQHPLFPPPMSFSPSPFSSPFPISHSDCHLGQLEFSWVRHSVQFSSFAWAGTRGSGRRGVRVWRRRHVGVVGHIV